MAETTKSIILNDNNYTMWATMMQARLQSKGLWRIMSTEVPKEKWSDELKALDEKARGTIILGMPTRMYRTVEKAETAPEVWAALKKRARGTGSGLKMVLLAQFFQASMRDGESLSQYLDRVVETVGKLDDVNFKLDSIIVCYKVLTSLGKSHDAIGTHCMMMKEKDLTVDFLREQFRRLESKDEIVKKEEDSEVLAIGRRKTQHQHQQPQQRQPREVKCYKCHEMGHFARDCPKKTRGIFHVEVLNTSTEEKDKSWYLDSGCTQHMTFQDDILTRERKTKLTVVGAINDKSKVETVGTVKMECRVGKKSVANTFDEVLLVPGLRKNLISVQKVCKHGGTVEFKGDRATVKVDGKVLIVAQKTRGNLYKVHEKSTREDANLASIDLWHQRLGHLSESGLRQLANKKLVQGLVLKPGEKLEDCKACLVGKQRRSNFGTSKGISTSAVGEVIHSDVCGPFPESLGGAKYFVSFIDDFSRKSWIYFIQRKSEVCSKFKEFHKMLENQKGIKIKMLRSDGGGEYMSGELKTYLRENGIRSAMTPPHTPQLNGVAERFNLTLLNKVRAMLDGKKLDQDFWAEAANTANFLRNISPVKILGNGTPEQKFSGRLPKVKKLRVFGCECHYKNNGPKSKLEPRARCGIFLGYVPEVGSYRVWDAELRRVVTSRDVVFQEEVEQKEKEKSEKEIVRKRNNQAEEEETEESEENSKEKSEEEREEREEKTEEEIEENEKEKEKSKEKEKEKNKEKEKEQSKEESEEDSSDVSHEVEESSKPRRSERLKSAKPPGAFWKVQTNLIEEEPQSYEEMKKSEEKEKWIQAIEEEMKSLKSMETWEVVDEVPGKPIVKNRWVFKKKLNEHGEVERFKARLVAKGYTQTQGVDYHETFSPVVKFETIRYMFALAAQRRWTLRQMDVNTAFLHGKLDEEIYMEQPEGYPIVPGKVYKLKKALYGLKQSSRCWNSRFTSFMKSKGFIASKSDPCLFTKGSGDKIVVVALYVDDLVITGDNREADVITRLLSREFSMKDLGLTKFLLGIRVTQKLGEVRIDQEKYVIEILKRFGMEDCKPLDTPAVPVDVNDSKPLDCKVPYREAVGCLNYLATRTRPDIAYAVSKVAQKMQSPNQEDWIAVKRIFRYLQGSKCLGLIFRSNNKELEGYSDASYAPKIDKRKSTSGYVFMMAGGAITWKSNRQSVVALSTTEAEYIAMAGAVKESLWLNQLRRSLEGPRDPLTVWGDNQSAIKLAENEMVNDRSKHIDVRYHFLRDHVGREVMLKYCPTQDMIADMLTKPLMKTQFKKFATQLGLFDTSCV